MSFAALLEQYALVLASLKEDLNAKVTYDLYADALVWTDEVPSVQVYQEGFSFSPFRSLFHYRSSVITGVPAEMFREKWDLAKARFPSWPLFIPSRSDRSLLPLYQGFVKSAESDEA